MKADKIDQAEIGETGHMERFQTSGEIARRCLVLYAVIAAGNGESKSGLIDWLRCEDLWNHASPREINFLEATDSLPQEIINAAWRVEALLPLLWALNKIPELLPPVDLCDIPAIRSVLPPLLNPVTSWISSAQMRDQTIIRSANENIYQIHWVVRDARLHGRPVSQNYNPGVVQERHHALNWLIGYQGQDWDRVTTDT